MLKAKVISLKDEIKEILEALRDSIDDTETDKVNFINWIDKIEDYITNLQEKYEKMKENAEIISKGYNDLEKRNEKAIEYCRLNKEFTPRLVDIENILNGGEKE